MVESHVSCPLLDLSRPVPSRYSLSGRTHRIRDADLIVCGTCDNLGGERKRETWEVDCRAARVAGEGQQMVSGSRPQR